MSNGVRISADTANSAVGADLAERLSAKVTTGAADIALVSAPPTEPATHVVVTGGISEAVDEWDRAVAPQTVAGALWITPGQDAALAAAALWVLRKQTPTTPLSDLTDTNERCLRWSVLGVSVALALGQIGVDTTLLALALAVIVGAPALTVALLTAFGGRSVAQEIAAGRALRSHVRVCYHLECGEISGLVVAVHPVAVEIETAIGEHVHVPYNLLLSNPYSVTPSRSNVSG